MVTTQEHTDYETDKPATDTVERYVADVSLDNLPWRVALFDPDGDEERVVAHAYRLYTVTGYRVWALNSNGRSSPNSGLYGFGWDGTMPRTLVFQTSSGLVDAGVDIPGPRVVWEDGAFRIVENWYQEGHNSEPHPVRTMEENHGNDAMGNNLWSSRSIDISATGLGALIHAVAELSRQVEDLSVRAAR